MQMVLSALRPTLREHLESVRREAVESRRIPEELASDAARCSAHRFSSWNSRPLSPHQAAQLKAYFNAVIRGKVMRSRGDGLAEVRRGLVIRSLIEDLLSAGLEEQRIIGEVAESLKGLAARHEIEGILVDMSLERAS